MRTLRQKLNKTELNIVKLINRGIFYGLKIEIYKIFFDQKYFNSRRKVILLFVLKLLNKIRNKQAELIFNIMNGSFETNSQLGQDLFVLQQLKNKKYGFFIEVGAGDGKTFSNTFLLEKKFNWDGILVEPNKTLYKKCVKTRECKVVNKLLLPAHKSSSKFYEMETGEFSYSEGYASLNTGEIKAVYEMPITNFEDLFQEYREIPKIDFVSIDTEGSELDIVSSIDFEKYKPTIICIEHNFRRFDRKFLKKYLKKRGYKLKYEGISRWDSWFVLKGKEISNSIVESAKHEKK